MSRLMRPTVLLVVILALCYFGPGGCRRASRTAENSGQQQAPQQESSGSQTSGDLNAPVPQPAQSTSGQPSAASDEGSSTATNGLPVAEPGAPTSVTAAAPESKPSPARTITVPAGTVLTIRMNQRVSVKTSRAGDLFTGRIASPVTENGRTVIPDGSAVTGVVLYARKRGHFKGESVLRLTLSGLKIGDQHYQIATANLTRTKKGKGKRSAALIGGGGGLGALIGGVATGGTGLIFGALAGSGAGTVTAAFTGNRDIDYPAESILSFRLDAPLELHP
jgi:hypothetical protein